MVVDKLYYSTHPFINAVSAGFSFDEQTVKDAVRRIYERKFDVSTDIDEEIFNETWNIFNKAVDEGFGAKIYSDPDFDFYQELRYNNAVFSAFRTHRLQNDIAAQLLDENGRLKSFEKFSNDVQSITDHNVRHWLRTEYDTAILRAHQAADWRQFEQVKDILPNLRWMTTTSVTPDLVHKRYWEARLTLPQDHSFWNEHRPGDRWNCKCSLEATDDPVQGTQVIDEDNQPKPDRGLDNNPGVDAKLFSDTHPYFSNSYVDRKKLLPVMDKMITEISRKDVREHFRKNPPKENYKVKEGPIAYLNISYQDIRTITGKPHKYGYYRNTFLYYLPEIFKEMNYLGWSLDIKNKTIPGHGDAERWHYYSFMLNNERSFLVVKENNLGGCRVHAIQDNDHFKVIKITNPWKKP